MTKKELLELAIEYGVADAALSNEDFLVSNGSRCSDEIVNFANALIEKCADIAIEYETLDSIEARLLLRSRSC